MACAGCKRKRLQPWARLALINAAFVKDGKPDLQLEDETALKAFEKKARIEMAQMALERAEASADDDGSGSQWCEVCCAYALAFGQAFCEVWCNYLGAGCGCCDEPGGGDPPPA